MSEPQFATLEELIAAVIERAVPVLVERLTPLIAQRADGALSLADHRHAQMMQGMQTFGTQHALALQELKAAIPVMPDLQPLVAALEANTAADLQENEFGPLVQSMNALVKQMASSDQAMRKMCEQMDKPMIRKGTAKLPSGGTVELMVEDTKSRAN